MNLELGQILKKLRKDHSLKQQDVANFLCISRPTYIRYERDEVETPLSKLFELADFYQFDIVDLVKLIENTCAKDNLRNEQPPKINLEPPEVKGCA
jgi:transcriptional regulator with XRE-family HTH domain